MNRRNTKGFLRLGVNQNKDKSFKESSFLNSVQLLLQEDIIQNIERMNILLYQMCPTIYQTFSKGGEDIHLSIKTSFDNYISFLKSNEKRDHEYIIPILKKLYPSIHIYIFENIKRVDGSNEIKIAYTGDIEFADSFLFIYKKEEFYEPIIFRDNTIQKLVELQKKCDLVTQERDTAKEKLIEKNQELKGEAHVKRQNEQKSPHR